MSITILPVHPTAPNTVEVMGVCACVHPESPWLHDAVACEARKEAFSQRLREGLKGHASSSCHNCDGTGWHTYELPELCINWNNANAQLLFALLGCEDMWDMGDLSIAEARRSLVVARTRLLSGDLSAFLRPMRREGNFFDPGVDKPYLEARIRSFATFVLECEKRGCTGIEWA